MLFPIHWNTEAVLRYKQTWRGACRGFQHLRQHFSVVLRCKWKPTSECRTSSPFFSHWIWGSGLPLAMQDIVCSLPRSFSALLMCSTHSGKAAEGQIEKWGQGSSGEEGLSHWKLAGSSSIVASWEKEPAKRLSGSLQVLPGSTHSPNTWTCQLWPNCLSLCGPIIN